MLKRRSVLVGGLALPFCAGAQPTTCGKLTAAQTEGPFFTPRSPQRASFLEKDFSGAKFVVAGLVLSPQCRPVANALLDFWHADESGAYDNQGYRYRGHQFTDAQGSYRLETIVPALYPGRARHIHVKVQAPGRRILTTQLYFAGDSGNARDRLYTPALEMRAAQPGGGRFDFVVDA